MNLWIVNQFAVPPRQSGGTRHFVLGRELVKRGAGVTVIASAVNYQSGEEIEFSGGQERLLENYEGVEFAWLRSVTKHGASGVARVLSMADFFLKLLAKRNRAGLRKPDIIIGSSPQPLAALAASFLASRMKVPFVLEVRDLWPDSLLDLGGYSKLHPFIVFLRLVEKCLYRRADAIITLLPGAGASIVEKGGNAENIIWVPNGVDVGEFPLTRPAPSRGTFQVLYAGAHGLANGLDTLLDAAKMLEKSGEENILFRLVGDGPRKAGLVERVAREKIGNVQFCAPVAKSEIPALMAEADAFYMPLKDSPVFKWGISPNKLFDYMASARPVVFAVNTQMNPVREAEAGISIPPEDAGKLAEAVLHLASLPVEERWRMGENGRAYVERNHDHAVLVDKLDEFLRSVLKR